MIVGIAGVFLLGCLVALAVLVAVKFPTDRPTTVVVLEEQIAGGGVLHPGLVSSTQPFLSQRSILVIVGSGVVVLCSIAAVLLVYFLVVLPARQSPALAALNKGVEDAALLPVIELTPQPPGDADQGDSGPEEQSDALLITRLIAACLVVMFIPAATYIRCNQLFPFLLRQETRPGIFEYVAIVCAFLIPAVVGMHAGAIATGVVMLSIYVADFYESRKWIPYDQAGVAPLVVTWITGLASVALSAVVDYRLVPFPIAIVPAFIAGGCAIARKVKERAGEVGVA